MRSQNKSLLVVQSRDRELQTSPKLADIAPAYQGLATGNNTLFFTIHLGSFNGFNRKTAHRFLPMAALHKKGAAGKAWFTPLETVIFGQSRLGQKHTESILRFIGRQRLPKPSQQRSSGHRLRQNWTSILAREILTPGVIGNAGSAIFPPRDRIPHLLCLLNHPRSQTTLNALNPSVNFTESDINALPSSDIPVATPFTAFLAAYAQYTAVVRPV